jgi:hypothetical protein
VPEQEQQSNINVSTRVPTMSVASRHSKTRVPNTTRRVRSERRTKNRLRELCEEVLASYRLAIGQDFVTDDDREVAQQYLRSMTPNLAG